MKKSSGLTLMEVLVSVAILSIALIAVLKSMLQVQDNLLLGQEKTIISLLPANKIAEVKAVGTENWSDFYGEFEGNPEYRWEVDISGVDENSLQTITVRIIDTKTKKEISTLQEQIFVQEGS